MVVRMPWLQQIAHNRHWAFIRATLDWAIMENGRPHGVVFHNSATGSSPIGEACMDCHGKNHDPVNADAKASKKRGLGHLLMMAACCGLPILFIALLPVLRGISGAWLDKVARYSFLLCPLMMIPMMLMNHGSSRWPSRRHGQELQRIEGREIKQITDQRK